MIFYGCGEYWFVMVLWLRRGGCGAHAKTMDLVVKFKKKKRKMVTLKGFDKL